MEAGSRLCNSSRNRGWKLDNSFYRSQIEAGFTNRTKKKWKLDECRSEIEAGFMKRIIKKWKLDEGCRIDEIEAGLARNSKPQQ